MNRTILIVICDFLLVSLLAFSTVDINHAANPTSARVGELSLTNNAPATNQVGARQDLGDVMRLALEEEKKNHDSLTAELSQVRSNASQQQALLAQRNEQIQSFQQQLQKSEAQSSRLLQQQTNLAVQMAAAQSNVQVLNEQLRSNTLQTMLTREERAAEEAEARKQRERAAALRAQLEALERTNQMVLAERTQLSNALQLTEAQKQATAAALARTEADLTTQRQQNTNLAEGIKVLASKSSDLVREIRENRPLAPNTIFDEFSTNRVQVDFSGVRPGFFGGSSAKDKQIQTILVTDGTNTFALCHVHDTLFSFWDPGTRWEELRGTISDNFGVVPIESLSFYLLDPRVALIPVPAAQTNRLGRRIYQLSKDPFKFQDAVVIGANGGYYGQCNFQIDLSTPQYLRMDHNSLKGLFGKFNPSTGDLVFSKTGDLMGVMANNTYCITLQKFEAAATFKFGDYTGSQPIAETLTSLYSVVNSLPFKLQ